MTRLKRDMNLGIIRIAIIRNPMLPEYLSKGKSIVRTERDPISNPGELKRRAIFEKMPSVFTTQVPVR